MLERYTHPADAETRRAVEISSRLARVGTKAGTVPLKPDQRQGQAVLEWLKEYDLEWHPQGEFYPLPCVRRWCRGSPRPDT